MKSYDPLIITWICRSEPVFSNVNTVRIWKNLYNMKQLFVFYL